MRFTSLFFVACALTGSLAVRDAAACVTAPPSREPGLASLQLDSPTIPRDGGILLTLTQESRSVDVTLAALSLTMTVDGKDVDARTRELGRVDVGDSKAITLVVETSTPLSSASKVAVRASGVAFARSGGGASGAFVDMPVAVSDVTLADLTTNAAASLTLTLGRALAFGDGEIVCTLAEPSKGEDSCGFEETTTQRSYPAGFENQQEVLVETTPNLPIQLVMAFTKTSLVDDTTGEDAGFVGGGTRFVLPAGAQGQRCFTFRSELVTRPGEAASRQVCIDAPALVQPSEAERVAYAKDAMKGARCASLANVPPGAPEGAFDEFVERDRICCSAAPGSRPARAPGALGAMIALGAMARLVARARTPRPCRGRA